MLRFENWPSPKQIIIKTNGNPGELETVPLLNYCIFYCFEKIIFWYFPAKNKRSNILQQYLFIDLSINNNLNSIKMMMIFLQELGSSDQHTVFSDPHNLFLYSLISLSLHKFVNNTLLLSRSKSLFVDGKKR